MLVLFGSVVLLVICNGLCAQTNSTQIQSSSLHNGLSERIGNFSVELLYHTSKAHKGQNLIMSPFTAWTALAVIAEGASGDTLTQIRNAIRLPKKRNITRSGFQNIAHWLLLNTTTVDLAKFNGLFVDQAKLLERDFRDLAKRFYDAEVVTLDFEDSENTASVINEQISRFTSGRIPKMVDSNDLSDIQVILTSALYFKGQWTAPFNASMTTKKPFYNSDRKKIGEVNMMFNSYTYPFANIKSLQARVIELPYGIENRLSMLIMMPDIGVTLEDMFLNFKKNPLDTVFNELRIAREEFGDEEIDCFIPRFKIESNLVLTNILEDFGIVDLFDVSLARLPFMARTPTYVTKVIHKAEIEVTEEGTTASGVTAAEFGNRIQKLQFEANRPFSYLIIERVTNSIVFGGIYQQPSLY